MSVADASRFRYTSGMAERIEIPTHVADEVLDGEAVLLNLQTGVYFGLNASGTHAWGILKRTGDARQVLAEMQHYYDPTSAPSSDGMRLDVQSWLGDLERCGLIHRTIEPDVTPV